MATEVKKSIPINLELADVRQALFDAAKTDPHTSNVLRYESGRAVGLMGNAMDTIQALTEALTTFATIEIGSDASCRVEIVPNGYSDPMLWRQHVEAARAAIAQAEARS